MCSLASSSSRIALHAEVRSWNSDERLAAGWLTAQRTWGAIEGGSWQASEDFWVNDVNRGAVGSIWASLCTVGEGEVAPH